MSIAKYNGFAAPYRSKTLRDEKDVILSRNGLLSIDGKITEAGLVVTIPPFTVSQNGLVMGKDVNTTVTKSASLVAPYYITVSALTSFNVDDLTFQFAKSPADVAPTEVILGEFDGGEWRPVALLSNEGIITDSWQDNIDLNQVGPHVGLTTVQVGLNLRNNDGVVIDRQGVKTTMAEDFITPILGTDPDWYRVDRMVYQRPDDSQYRIGTRKLVLGGTYKTSGPSALYDTQLDTSVSQHSSSKVLISPVDNSAHFLYSEGFGASFQIKYTKYDSARTGVVVPTLTLITCDSKDFDAALDSTGNIYISYANSSNLFISKYNNAGSLISGPISIEGLAIPCSNPSIKIDPDNTKIFIAFEALIGPSNSQIYLTTRNLALALVTSPVLVTSGFSNLINPNIFVTNDLYVYLAFEDSTVTSVSYKILNDIGGVLQSDVVISSNSGSTSYGTLVNGASKPVIQVSQNKHVFVAFLQKKTIPLTGLCIYQNGSGFVPNLIGMSENINAFDMIVDHSMNELHLSVSQTARVDYIKLAGYITQISEQISIASANDMSIVKDIYGSIVHTWTAASPGTYANIGTPQATENFGPAAITGSLNNLILTAAQVSFLVATLTHTPVVGERMTVTGSVAGNNGVYYVSAVETRSIDALNDTIVVTATVSFPFAEINTPATTQFAVPNGNEVRFIKTIGEKDQATALRTDYLDTDVLLARIMMPGPVILNYLPAGMAGVNSDVFGMYGDVDVDWSASTVGALTMTSGTNVIDLVNNFVYTISGGTFAMSEGDALYAIFDGVTFSIAPQVSPINALPWALPIQVLGFVKNGEFNPHLFSVAGMGQLDVGEQVTLGQDLSKAQRNRLGITGEATFTAYTSTTQISPLDSHPIAISKLDLSIATILASLPVEESFISTGQTVFTCASIAFSASNLIYDIVVDVNGVKKRVDPTGGVANNYRKISTTQIEFNETIPAGTEVTIRQERTGGIGPSQDLTNISVNPQPVINGGQTLGTVTKAWGKVFMKDTVTAQNYELKIVSGVFQIVAVP